MPPKSRPQRSPAEPPVPPRQQEVLEAALALIAEQGVAGASLRELAKRLGMSQPSLYHYFESKEELVSKIVSYCIDQMLAPVSGAPWPSCKEELPRFVTNQVLAMWSSETHPRFMRFLFAVALAIPPERAKIRAAFRERLNPAFEMVARRYAEGDTDVQYLASVLRMLTNSLAFPLMEERALLQGPKLTPALREYADFATAAAERLLSLPPELASRKSRSAKRAGTGAGRKKPQR